MTLRSEFKSNKVVCALWPDHTGDWFGSGINSPVPHNFESADSDTKRAIDHYFFTIGTASGQAWQLDKVLYQNLKRFVGHCSAPHNCLNEKISTEPLYLSFLAFAFEMAISNYLKKNSQYITSPGFFDRGNSLLLRQEEPPVASDFIIRLIRCLFGTDEFKQGFIYLALINDDAHSNIEDMHFNKSGELIITLATGLSSPVINNINRSHNVTHDRAGKIAELKTLFASSDSYFSLHIETRNNKTLISFVDKDIIDNSKDTSKEHHKTDNNKPSEKTSEPIIGISNNINNSKFKGCYIGNHIENITIDNN